MPIDYNNYPPEWPTISLSIRVERANNCCEWCGAVNGSLLPSGKKRVLTVAHLGTPHADGTPGNKHDKWDVRPENLAALCQRCHLNYDRDDHIQHAKETRRKKKLAQAQAVGQGFLFFLENGS